MDSLQTTAKVAFLAFIFTCSLFIIAEPALAQKTQYASERRKQASVGYYSRARTMLVEALEEYEQGRRYARPDLLHDPEEFRLTLISLTEQLNRLVEPRARITRDGVRFQANPRMIRRQSKRSPVVKDGAKDANDYGEKARLKQKQAARARLYEARPEPKVEAKMTEKKSAKTNSLEMSEDLAVEDSIQEPENTEEMMKAKEMMEPSEEPSEIAETEEKELFNESTEAKAPQTQDNSMEGGEVEAASNDEPSEDERIASAIESAIQDRLKSLEVDLEDEGEE